MYLAAFPKVNLSHNHDDFIKNLELVLAHYHEQICKQHLTFTRLCWKNEYPVSESNSLPHCTNSLRFLSLQFVDDFKTFSSFNITGYF